ncbi:PAS domain-containing protein [Flaviaesturariibacter amylovorans]|uniref:histidine kinase n=1 Tax=Flaviaesturariibacter amylovorans TaxID=1084520 RepID=A0ABP8HNS0_9BACT
MNTNDTRLYFEQARAHHLAFKARLRAYLYGSPADDTALRAPRQCSLGKWIYGHALPLYGDLPGMKALESVHNRIHEQATELIDLYNSGNKDRARAGLADIEPTAAELVDLLTQVERQVAGDAAPGHSETFRAFGELMQANQELERTVRAYSDAAVSEQKTLYEVLMQLPAHISLLMGDTFVFELVNPPALAVIGGRDVIGKRLGEAFPELEEQGFGDLLMQVYRSGEPYLAKELPARLNFPDGSTQEYFVDVTYLPFRDSAGSIVGVISFSYDVTDAVRARRRIQESEERFRFMSDALPNQAWTARADGSLDYVNERTCRYFNRSEEEITGAGWQHVVHPDDLPGVIEQWTRSLQTLEPYRVEFRLLCHNGEYRWHLGQANAFTSSSGEVKWYGSNTDIHDLKTLQDRLQQAYDDLEVKVRFRNIELERLNLELREKLDGK